MNRLLAPAYAGVLLLFANQSVLAAPVHPHCYTETWQRTSDDTNPVVPSNYTNNGLNFFIFRVPLISPPPLSGIANCLYEISDIRAIDITFRFEGRSMQWDSLLINVEGPPFRTVAVDATTAYINDTAFFLRFNAHQDNEPGLRSAIELQMPSGDLTYNLGGLDNSMGNVTYAQIVVRGTHYYLVSEPGGIALVMLGLFCIYGIQRSRSSNHSNCDYSV